MLENTINALIRPELVLVRLFTLEKTRIISLFGKFLLKKHFKTFFDINIVVIIVLEIKFPL